MLVWDPEQVAALLGTPAVFEENSSFRFVFIAHGHPATLCVFPYNGDVQLTIGKDGHHWANWRMNCSAIKFNDEIPEEGGPCLVFNPASSDFHDALPSHWMVLGPSEEGFRILTVFREPVS